MILRLSVLPHKFTVYVFLSHFSVIQTMGPVASLPAVWRRRRQTSKTSPNPGWSGLPTTSRTADICLSVRIVLLFLPFSPTQSLMVWMLCSNACPSKSISFFSPEYLGYLTFSSLISPSVHFLFLSSRLTDFAINFPLLRSYYCILTNLRNNIVHQLF